MGSSFPIGANANAFATACTSAAVQAETKDRAAAGHNLAAAAAAAISATIPQPVSKSNVPFTNRAFKLKLNFIQIRGIKYSVLPTHEGKDSLLHALSENLEKGIYRASANPREDFRKKLSKCSSKKFYQAICSTFESYLQVTERDPEYQRKNAAIIKEKIPNLEGLLKSKDYTNLIAGYLLICMEEEYCFALFDLPIFTEVFGTPIEVYSDSSKPLGKFGEHSDGYKLAMIAPKNKIPQFKRCRAASTALAPGRTPFEEFVLFPFYSPGMGILALSRCDDVIDALNKDERDLAARPVNKFASIKTSLNDLHDSLEQLSAIKSFYDEVLAFWDDHFVDKINPIASGILLEEHDPLNIEWVDNHQFLTVYSKYVTALKVDHADQLGKKKEAVHPKLFPNVTRLAFGSLSSQPDSATNVRDILGENPQCRWFEVEGLTPQQLHSFTLTRPQLEVVCLSRLQTPPLDAPAAAAAAAAASAEPDRKAAAAKQLTLVEALKPLMNPRRLRLERCGVNGEIAKQLIEVSLSIRQLALPNVQLSAADCIHMIEQRRVGLQALNLCSRKKEYSHGYWPSGIPSDPQFEAMQVLPYSFHLTEARIVSDGSLIRFLSGIPTLRVLDLSNIDFSDHELTTLELLGNLEGLEVLRLRNCNGNANTLDLSKIAAIESLVELDISGFNFSSADDLLPLGDLRNLRKLYCGGVYKGHSTSGSGDEYQYTSLLEQDAPDLFRTAAEELVKRISPDLKVVVYKFFETVSYYRKKVEKMTALDRHF